MDTILQFLTGVLRYVLPVLALLILAVCVISLFRNRPRVHKMAQLVDQNNGSVMDITHWETSIGKSKANDVVLPLPSVSRFHAVIAKKKDGWMVTDTFSKNGVQVNGVPVDQRAPLADGDILMIGTIPLQFLGSNGGLWRIGGRRDPPPGIYQKAGCAHRPRRGRGYSAAQPHGQCPPRTAAPHLQGMGGV